MNDKISDKDKKDWQNFISSKEKIPDKDFKIKTGNITKIRSIDLHGYTLEQANNTIEEFIIKAFEETKHGHEFIDNNHKPCFTQLNMNQYHPELVKILVNWTRVAYSNYVDLTQNKFIPDFHSLEEFRIKRLTFDFFKVFFKITKFIKIITFN